jgi:hypothetical protein
MKLIKLILAISFLVGINTKILAQTFYESNTNIIYIVSFETLSPGSRPYVFKDSIILDSINSMKEEYYTVKQRGEFDNIDSTYNLKVKNKQVFYSGYLTNKGIVSNKLIYDFNYDVGDTFSLYLNELYRFRVDSIKQIIYLDGISRKTHYYKFPSGETFAIAEGLACLKRPNYFNFRSRLIKKGNMVISVCNGANNLIYFDGNLKESQDTTYDASCDVKLLKKYVIHAGISLNSNYGNSFMVYPNPCNEILNIKLNNIENGILKITNSLGQILYKTNFENTDNLQFELPHGINGLVYVTIQTNTYSTTKVVVVE